MFLRTITLSTVSLLLLSCQVDTDNNPPDSQQGSTQDNQDTQIQSDNMINTDPEILTNTVLFTQTATDSQSETNTQSETKTDTDSQSETATQLETKTATDSQTETNVSSQIETDTNTETAVESVRVKLEDLHFESEVISWCLNNEAYNQFTYVDELKHFGCSTDGGKQLITYFFEDRLAQDGTFKYLIDSIVGLNQLTALESLYISNNWIIDANQLDLPNLKVLNLSENSIRHLDVSKLKNLEALYLNTNPIESLNVTGLEKLETLIIQAANQYGSTLEFGREGIIFDREYEIDYVHLIPEISISDFTLPIEFSGTQDLVNLKILDIHSHDVINFDFTNAVKLETLTINNGGMSEINLVNSENLIELNLDDNNLRELDLSNHKKLETVSLEDNSITNIDLSSAIKLKNINIGNNLISELDLNDSPELIEIQAYSNRLVDVTFNSDVLQLADLRNNWLDQYPVSINTPPESEILLNDNQLTEFTDANLELPKTVELSDNQIKTVNINNSQYLEILKLDGNVIERLNIDNSAEIEVLKFTVATFEQLSSDRQGLKQIINLTGLDKLTSLQIDNYQWQSFVSFDFVEFENLNTLLISSPVLTELNLDSLSDLEYLYISNSPELTGNINITGNNNLIGLSIKDTQIEDIDITSNIKLEDLTISRSPLKTLDITSNLNLSEIIINDTLLTSLDISNNLQLGFYNELKNNQLTQLIYSSPEQCEKISYIMLMNNFFTQEQRDEMNECFFIGIP